MTGTLPSLTSDSVGPLFTLPYLAHHRNLLGTTNQRNYPQLLLFVHIQMFEEHSMFFSDVWRIQIGL